MGTTTGVFSGNAATPYAAFNLRDRYYWESARFVIDAAKARLGGKLGNVVDLGAGIGISTMEALKDAKEVVAVEPEESMRYFLRLNVMGDPRVTILDGKAEHLHSAIQYAFTDYQDSSDVHLDAVLCCQVFHLFNPPGKESGVGSILDQISKVLREGGVLAFDLGPSNFEFATPIADHRSGKTNRGEVLTELAHPLYQLAHQLLYRIVKREFPEFGREDLWPPVAARINLTFLKEECKKAGLLDLQVSEEFLPVSGKRVIDFVRSGWAVFFRWPPLSELPADKKLTLMDEALRQLFREPDFQAMSTVMSYHPTAVFTAVKD